MRLSNVVLAAAGLSLALLAGCTGSDPAPAPSSSEPGPPPPMANAGPPADPMAGGGPVPPPATGALIGAWVNPGPLSQPSRIAAVQRLEGRIGRRLDIINTYRKWEDRFFTQSDLAFMKRGSILMLSWAGPDSRAVTLGRHDNLIRARARQVAADGRPVLLRYRWEMDRPNLRASMWSGADFVAAWKHVRRIFAEEGATNAAWVWCPTAEGFAGGYAPDFYPGDDQVDWLCVDVYAGRSPTPLSELLAPFLSWSAPRPKPIIIGEFGVSRAYPSARRAEWLRAAAETFRTSGQIKAVS